MALRVSLRIAQLMARRPPWYVSRGGLRPGIKQLAAGAAAAPI